MRTRAGKCETCAHWRATAKGFFGPTVDRSVRGWCAKQVAVTFDSGHCAGHEPRKPVSAPVTHKVTP